MNTTTATARKLAEATAARRAAEATGTAAEQAAAAVAELEAWCEDFDARTAPAECTETECNAPAAQQTHRVLRPGTRAAAPRSEQACKACKVAELTRREASAVAAIRDGALGRRGGAHTALRSLRNQLAKLTA